MTASKIEQILNLSPITLVNGEEVWHDGELICRAHTVAKVKIKLELMNRDLLTAVETIVENAPAHVKLLWKEANTFNRISPTIEGIRIQLGLTHAEVNDIFEQAEGIML